MNLIRNKESELYDAQKGVFEERIPNNTYEIIIRGELKYAPTEYDHTWINTTLIPKELLPDRFIEELLNIKQEKALKIKYNRFVNWKYKVEDFILDKEYMELNLNVETEDQFKMEQQEQYKPITKNFEIFITLNKDNKHYDIQ